jgi:hypothetical protein
MQKLKIPISAIQDVMRAVEGAPDCDETEVPKVEAMRRLIPAIKTMQAKGYGLAHIAKLLSDNGIAVTEVTLKHYVHRLSAQTIAESSRKGVRDRPTTGAPARGSSKTAHVADHAPPSVPRNQRALVPVDATSHDPVRSSTGSASLESARQGPAPSATEGAGGRSGFVVRPDTKKI